MARGRSGRASQHTPTRQQKKSPQENKRSTTRTSRASRRTARSAPDRQLRQRGTLWSRLPLNRKLDLLGIALTFIGILTLLSLLSSNRSLAPNLWVKAITSAFGWGGFIFPIGLTALGLWLILRHFERIPKLVPARALGIVLLYFNLLVAVALLFPPQSAQGQSPGGSVGAGILAALRPSLGWGGTVTILLAWLLLALAFALDVSVLEIVQWLSPRLKKGMSWLSRLRFPWQGFTRKNLPPDYPIWSTLKPTTSDKSSTQGSVAGGLSPTTLTRMRDEPAHTWRLPSVSDILEAGDTASIDADVDRQRARIIEETLSSFGAPVRVVEINRGPTITQFGVEPDFIETRGSRMRVRVSKIAALADDLALALSARRIRIQAPVPSKGFVGIEVPNDEFSLVALRDIIESEVFQRVKSPLRFALGQDVAGNPVAADLASMPHLLIAGATGTGKSVCINALICCLLLNNTPNEMRLILVDPKRVELSGYNGIPHLLAPVIVELDRVLGALQWVSREMDQRYHKLAQVGARNLDDYNNRMLASHQPRLPRLVLIIDELADLMMLAPDETERTITRLAQLARATGIHLVIATQRPSVEVVTGLIKANFPSRISFAVASGVDSRVILDQPGAERLLGQGDMLFQPPDSASPVRLQGVFVSDIEILRLVSYWREFNEAGEYEESSLGGIVDALPAGIPLKQMPMWEDIQSNEDADPLYNEAVELVRKQGRASISMLQRRLRIGYTRAARLIERMQEMGVVNNSQPSSQGWEVLENLPEPPDEEDKA